MCKQYVRMSRRCDAIIKHLICIKINTHTTRFQFLKFSTNLSHIVYISRSCVSNSCNTRECVETAPPKLCLRPKGPFGCHSHVTFAHTTTSLSLQPTNLGNSRKHRLCVGSVTHRQLCSAGPTLQSLTNVTARYFACCDVYKQVKSDSKTPILCALQCFCVCVFCRMCTVQTCGILMSVPSLRITIMQICSVQMTLPATRTSISQDHIRAHQGNCGSSLKTIPPPVLLTPIHPILRHL